ncbi:MAG: DedA family protein [Anaerolineaceae bacterium]|nr:DedA family protein [Anaerolineaceae bacterium]
MDLAAILNAIKDWTSAVIGSMGYPGLVLVMFLENVFPPIPSEVVLPLAGDMTRYTEFSIFWVVFWGMIGSLLGAFFFYYIALWFGEKRMYWVVEKVGKFLFIKKEDLDNSFKFFEKYGEWTIFFGRMIPLVRSLISIPAGLAKMSLPKFIAFTVAGTTAWNIILVMAGRILGPAWPVVVEWVGVYQNIVVVLILVGGAAFLGIRIYQSIKNRNAKKETVETSNLE